MLVKRRMPVCSMRACAALWSLCVLPLFVCSATSAAPPTPQNAKQRWFSPRVKYKVMEFKGDLNWNKRSRLVRMIPDAKLAWGRHFAHAVRDRQELAKPVVNVVILVHGHNEKEKVGKTPVGGPDPWEVDYKRDVWSYMYRVFLGDKQYADRVDSTAFYEFIYPTYHAAYSPIRGRKTLGEVLANKLAEGAPNDGGQLKKLLDAAAPVNVYIVAHSMGGLVARSAFTHWNNKAHHDFQQLITWGTPHHGSPIVTVGYAINSPLLLNANAIDRLPAYLKARKGGFWSEWSKGVATIVARGHSAKRSYYNGIFELKMQMDAPGSRDLRWDAPETLLLDNFFSPHPAHTSEADYNLYGLGAGLWLYNGNLALFNADDPYRLSDKYTFFYGITTKTLLKHPGFISGGNTAMPLLMKNAAKPLSAYRGLKASTNDGAVPLRSMAGGGICRSGRTVNVGDISHEEYYGAPKKGKVSRANADKAERVARATFLRLGIQKPRSAPPTFDVLSPMDAKLPNAGERVDVKARLKFPYPRSFDPTPKRRVRTAEAMTKIGGKNVVLGKLKVGADCTISGTVTVPEKADGQNFFVRATLVDDTYLDTSPVVLRRSVPTWVLTRHWMTSTASVTEGEREKKVSNDVDKEKWRGRFETKGTFFTSRIRNEWTCQRPLTKEEKLANSQRRTEYKGRDDFMSTAVWSVPRRVAREPNIVRHATTLVPFPIYMEDKLGKTQKRTGELPSNRAWLGSAKVICSARTYASNGKPVDVDFVSMLVMKDAAKGARCAEVLMRFDTECWPTYYKDSHKTVPNNIAKDKGAGWKVVVTMHVTHGLAGALGTTQSYERHFHYEYTFDPTGRSVRSISLAKHPNMFAKLGPKKLGKALTAELRKRRILEEYTGPKFSGHKTPIKPPAEAKKPVGKPGKTRMVGLATAPKEPRAGMKVAFEIAVENPPAAASYSWSFGEKFYKGRPSTSAWTETPRASSFYSKPGKYTVTVTVRNKRRYQDILDKKRWTVNVAPAKK